MAMPWWVGAGAVAGGDLTRMAELSPRILLALDLVGLALHRPGVAAGRPDVLRMMAYGTDA